MPSYSEVLQEAEAQRQALEAHAESVRLARKNALYALAKEADAAIKGKRAHQPLAPSPRRDVCQKYRQQITEWVASGVSFAAIADMLSEIEKADIYYQMIQHFCKKEGIEKPERVNADEVKLTESIEEVKRLIAEGITRPGLLKHFGVSKHNLDTFLAANKLGTGKSHKRADFNTLYRRFA